MSSTTKIRKENLAIPQVKVNDKHGSFSSLASSDKSYSPAGSPRRGRKMIGFKKMMPWRRKDHDTDHEGDEMKQEPIKKKISIDSLTRKPAHSGRKIRSRSVDHLLTDKSVLPNVEISPQSVHAIAVRDIEARLHSPARSSFTDEESGDGESGADTYDATDGMDNTERFNEERRKLKRKIEKTKEIMRKLQSSMDEHVEQYLESAKVKPETDLSKKAFEKRNFKANADIAQHQKKLDKYQKALKDLDTREQRAKTHTAKEVFRGVRSSVKEISGSRRGESERDTKTRRPRLQKRIRSLPPQRDVPKFLLGVRDGVKAGFSGAVSKFYKSNENITDPTHPFSKSDSECQELQGNDVESFTGNDVRKTQTPSPKNVFSEEDNYSLTSANQTSAPNSVSRYSETGSEHPLEAKLKELLDAQNALKETVEKAVFDINAIATSLQEERYKTQDLECQFNTLRSHWNDFSELHQHENMQLRQDIQRNDESIATVDYRLIERVAEIDESFDTFDARISKIENVHQQQQGLNVDDYFEQNIQAKAVLTKFLSVVLAVVTLLFSIFTLIVHGIAPFTRTRFRLVIATVLIVFLATWWHNPNQYVVKHFQRLIVEPLSEIFKFLSSKLTNIRKHSPDVT